MHLRTKMTQNAKIHSKIFELQEAPLMNALTRIHGLPSDVLLDRQQRLLEAIAQARPLPEILGNIARFSEEVTPSMLASILIFDPESACLRKGGYGRLPESFQNAVDGMVPGPQVGSCGTAAYIRERVISYDVRRDPLWEPFKEFAANHGIVSAWSTPLLGGKQELLGVFGMYYGDCREPTPDDLELVDHFVHLASVAIEKHLREQELQRHATRDLLTGVANRQSLHAYVEELAVKGNAEPLASRSWTLALMDIDYFRLHNSLLGSRNADKLLVIAASRLQEAIGKEHFLARLGSDQFIALLPETGSSASDQLNIALRAASAPVVLDGQTISLTLSMGWVTWQPGEEDFDLALSQAIAALNDAKRLGRNQQVYFDDVKRRATQRKHLVNRELTLALRENRVQPVLQPIVELGADRVSGFEVLARLSGESGCRISPAEFIPVAEESALIESLGGSIMRFANATLARSDPELRQQRLNVNVSTRQLLNQHLCANFLGMTREYGVDPSRIIIEVTESAWLDSDSPARSNLLQLKDAGFGLALDDFGTGYASFSFLRSIPFDQVKIDKSFVDQLLQGKEGRVMCEAILAMAEALQLKVTAEGVEQADQASTLNGMGCSHGQGYFWARPMPLESALSWLRSRNAPQK